LARLAGAAQAAVDRQAIAAAHKVRFRRYDPFACFSHHPPAFLRGVLPLGCRMILPRWRHFSPAAWHDGGRDLADRRRPGLLSRRRGNADKPDQPGSRAERLSHRRAGWLDWLCCCSNATSRRRRVPIGLPAHHAEA
jgi:hypothetical protein